MLGYDDVMKLDFGTQIGGRIVDSAFTVGEGEGGQGKGGRVRASSTLGRRSAAASWTRPSR